MRPERDGVAPLSPSGVGLLDLLTKLEPLLETLKSDQVGEIVAELRAFNAAFQRLRLVVHDEARLSSPHLPDEPDERTASSSGSAP